MSINRWRESSININSNPSFVYTITGDQATGNQAPYTNNVFNLKTLMQNKVLSLEGLKLDLRDRYPDNAGGFTVAVNGILQDITKHFSYTKPTITFNKEINSDDTVKFII